MGKTIVCHCEDITLEELFSAIEQGYTDIESIKRYTGIATGTCQGKCCLIQTLRALAAPPDPFRGKPARSQRDSGGPGDAFIKLPTIRQPVLPARINEILDSDQTPGEKESDTE